jgi:membrane fusion protein (multidrug efflux system)
VDTNGENHDARAQPSEQQAANAELDESLDSESTSRPGFHLKTFKAVVLLVVVLCLAAGGGIYWWRSTFWVSTDDAQVDGNIIPVSARISGHILHVNVNENDAVKAGTVLVEIDPSDYNIAYERARAAYADAVAKAQAATVDVQLVSTKTASALSEARAAFDNARIGVQVARKQLTAAEADLREAEAQNQKAQKDFERFRVLVKDKAVSVHTYDQYAAAAKTAAATVEAARAHVKAFKEQVHQAEGQLVQAKARLQAARSGPDQVAVARAQAESAAATVKKLKADLNQAQLDLTYTKVIAPVSGIVGPKPVDVGPNVQPGQLLLYIVPLDEIWVTADFRETDLRRVRPGQPARIHVDTYDRDYNGRVASIGGATGEQFSLFPPENATGNYVKVVQRIPVKIVFDKGQDPKHLLRPGMSVEVEIRVKK